MDVKNRNIDILRFSKLSMLLTKIMCKSKKKEKECLPTTCSQNMVSRYNFILEHTAELNITKHF